MLSAFAEARLRSSMASRAQRIATSIPLREPDSESIEFILASSSAARERVYSSLLSVPRVYSRPIILTFTLFCIISPPKTKKYIHIQYTTFQQRLQVKLRKDAGNVEKGEESRRFFA